MDSCGGVGGFYALQGWNGGSLLRRWVLSSEDCWGKKERCERAECTQGGSRGMIAAEHNETLRLRWIGGNWIVPQVGSLCW